MATDAGDRPGTPSTGGALADAIHDKAARYQSSHVTVAYYLENRETGDDGGPEYCHGCAWKNRKGHTIRMADRSAHYDSEPICEGCGKSLYGWLTDWGASELLGVLEDGFDPNDESDCYVWMLIENSFLRDSDEYKRLMNVARNPKKREVVHAP